MTNWLNNKTTWLKDLFRDTSDLFCKNERNEDIRINPQMKVKFCSKTNVKMGIFDGKETIMAMFGDGEFAEGPSIWSNSPAIVNLAEGWRAEGE